MAKVYLAARYSRRQEMLGVRDVLEAFGHEITSRWINSDHQVDDKGLSVEAEHSERVRFAIEDWKDLQDADWVLNFTEPPRSTNSRGGRHVELGGALALGKRCIVIGPRENVFHCLPQVELFKTWRDFVAAVCPSFKETA